MLCEDEKSEMEEATQELFKIEKFAGSHGTCFPSAYYFWGKPEQDPYYIVTLHCARMRTHL